MELRECEQCHENNIYIEELLEEIQSLKAKKVKPFNKDELFQK